MGELCLGHGHSPGPSLGLAPRHCPSLFLFSLSIKINSIEYDALASAVRFRLHA